MQETQKSRMLGWGMLYIVLLLSLILPPVGLFTVFALTVPLLVMYVRLGFKPFLVYYSVSLLVVYVVVSSLFAGFLGALLLSVSIFFLPPVVYMGNLYKKRATARSVLTAGTVTLLAELLVSLLVAHLFGLNPVGQLKNFMRESIMMYSPEMQSMLGMEPDVLVQYSVQLLPLYMISFSLLHTVITHRLARKSLVKAGEPIPAFRPVKDWMLPRSFIWVYVIGLVLQMFMRDPNTTMYTIILNLLPLMSTAFAVQGIAFLFYLAHSRGWGRTLPVLGIVLMVVFPPVFFLLSLLGVFDVAFPLRDRIHRKE